MKLVIFGLAVSSSWGNGHAALWRGLINAFIRAGHAVAFFERDVPYYAEHRDLFELPRGGTLVLYDDWNEATPRMRTELGDADVAIITSYCPDGRSATKLALESNVTVRCFYDLDTPITLARLEAGEEIAYLGPEGLAPFNLIFSYTGGAALNALRTQLGARRAYPIYGSVDPDLHRPVPIREEYCSILSYLGTYASDRQNSLNRLLLEPAQTMREHRFVIAGAQYPDTFPWAANIYFLRHLPPSEHAAFYSSSKLTLNITRDTMAKMGWCPSGRLFEAAACGVPILSDWFDGLSDFFQPDEEILVAHTTQDAMKAIRLDSRLLSAIAKRARERVLDEHTANHRAAEMVAAFEAATSEAS